MNLYEITFGNGQTLLQIASSHVDCLEKAENYDLIVAKIKLIKGKDELDINQDKANND